MSERIFTPRAILSYPHLTEPVVDDSGNAKYSAALIFPQGTDISALKKAAVAILVEKFGAKKAKEGIRDGTFRLPFRSDWEKKGYPEGSTFINVRTKKKPGCVSQVPDPKNGGKPTKYTDEEVEEEMYAGCFVIASLTPFYYPPRKGNQGVSFGLNNLQKVGEGEPLGNRVAADDEFTADPNATANLADVDDDDDGDLVTTDNVEGDDEGPIDLSDLID